MDTAALQFLSHLAKALAAQFGPGCEVVIHDLCPGSTSSSIAAIENGCVSGRKVGDGPSPVEQEALDSGSQGPVCRLVRSADGKTLKSTTVPIQNECGETVGLFAIHCDITSLLAAEDALRQFTTLPGQGPGTSSIGAVQNVSALLDELIEQSVKRVGRPVDEMTREDKVNAIRFLNDTGAFLVTKSGAKVCKYFGISKYTLYSYIEEAKKSS